MNTCAKQLVMTLRLLFGVPVIDVTRLANGARQEEFKRAAKARNKSTEMLLRQEITANNRYDWEYMSAEEIERRCPTGSQFNGSHYWHWSPAFELAPRFVPPLSRILEVGCGGGLLISRLIKAGVPKERLVGCDLSETAGKRVRELGAKFSRGPVRMIPGTFGLILHSYFIDRDADQAGTLRQMCKKLVHGGVLFLEGWFPCTLSDTHEVSYGTPNLTKGQTAEEDISLVVDFVRSQRGMKLEKIFVGQRFVYSLDGPETLPSHILVFRRE